MTADVRSFSTAALVSAVPPADVRSFSTAALVSIVGPADLRSIAVAALVTSEDVLQPGIYVKADDGNLYPMAQFPWSTS